MILRGMGALTAQDLALLEQYKPPAGSGSSAQAAHEQYRYLLENWRDNDGRRWVNGQWVQSDTPPPPPDYSGAVYNLSYAQITGGNWTQGAPYVPGQYLMSAGTAKPQLPPGYTSSELGPAGYVPPKPAEAAPAKEATKAPTASEQKTPAGPQPAKEEQPAPQEPAPSIVDRVFDQPWYVIAGAVGLLLFGLRGSR
jgi:hypothetical protein